MTHKDGNQEKILTHYYQTIRYDESKKTSITQLFGSGKEVY
jgi:hypothetical protein